MPEADDYEVIRLSISWGGVSIVAFAVLMGIQVLGFSLLQMRLIQIIGATLVLAFVGLVLGLIGLRLGAARRAARLGVFLNGAVLFCLFVLLPLTYLLRR